jgi:hypothetical protein
MSVTHHRRRRLGIAAGTALLTLGAAGCSVLGRTAVGPVTYETPQKRLHQVTVLPVRGCHRFKAPGAVQVSNGTMVDLVMFPASDCSGGGTTYISTTLSDRIAPGAAPWRSYIAIH